MSKFELFMCRLGNGTTVCNKAVMKNNDYKIIAHISDGGNIKFYVAESYIQQEDMARIRAVAESEKRKFQNEFLALPEIKQYGIILDNMGIAKMLETANDKRELPEKLPGLREWYFSVA